MIKTEELMLGNLVYDEVLGEVEVVEIYEDSILVKYFNLTDKHEIEEKTTKLVYGDFRSIAITDNVLSSFGFEFLNHNEFHLNGFCLEKYGAMFLERRYGIPVNHVHKLQNLYYLITGKKTKQNN